MKYKVGDKVRVREDLEVDEYYDGLSFEEEMAYFKGKIVTIERVRWSESYKLKEDNDGWYWNDEMLEDLEENEKNG